MRDFILRRSAKILPTSKILRVLTILLIPTSVFPFDGQRKGFNAGLGIGFSPSTNFDIQNSVDESNSAFTVKVLVGYGFDDKNLLTYQIIGNSIKSKVLDNSEIVQGLDGIQWYHYFRGPSGDKIFVSAGIGAMVFATPYSNLGGRGLGFELGTGYELKRHFQLELFYIWGETDSGNNRTADHTMLVFLLSAHAF